jgi:hypothetical protein
MWFGSFCSQPSISGLAKSVLPALKRDGHFTGRAAYGCPFCTLKGMKCVIGA